MAINHHHRSSLLDVPISRPGKFMERHQNGPRNYGISQNGAQSAAVEFHSIPLPVNLFTSLKEVFKFENMRDQLRFLQFDVDCNFFLHR